MHCSRGDWTDHDNIYVLKWHFSNWELFLAIYGLIILRLNVLYSLKMHENKSLLLLLFFLNGEKTDRSLPHIQSLIAFSVDCSTHAASSSNVFIAMFRTSAAKMHLTSRDVPHQWRCASAAQYNKLTSIMPVSSSQSSRRWHKGACESIFESAWSSFISVCQKESGWPWRYGGKVRSKQCALRCFRKSNQLHWE